MALPWKCSCALSVFVVAVWLQQPTLAAEMKFKKEVITLGGKKIPVEIAKTEEQRQHGLMYRKSLPTNGGMLFIFESEQPLSFWMKNTLIDLSIGYFDKNQVLVDVQEMVPLSPMEAHPTSYPSAKPAMYALEMNKGWFGKNKIKTGQRFQFESRRR